VPAMSTPLAPGAPWAVTLAVLVVALVIGIASGRAKGRWSLLLAGLVGAVGLGVVLTVATGAGDAPGVGEDPGAELGVLYAVTVPLVVAFGAGWLCGRATWSRRFLVLAVAVLLLAAFPYDAAGRFTADAFLAPASAANEAETVGATH
jgi:hypothetical protein